jgi:hypothetical protein
MEGRRSDDGAARRREWKYPQLDRVRMRLDHIRQVTELRALHVDPAHLLEERGLAEDCYETQRIHAYQPLLPAHKGVAKERAEKAAAMLALMVECRDEGRAKHAAGVLVRLLTRKFATVPDEVRARIDTASLEQLDTWTERVLDAATLDEVFR